VPHIAAVSPEVVFCRVLLRRILGTPPYQIKVNFLGDFLGSRMLTFCSLQQRKERNRRSLGDACIARLSIFLIGVVSITITVFLSCSNSASTDAYNVVCSSYFRRQLQLFRFLACSCLPHHKTLLQYAMVGTT